MLCAHSTHLPPPLSQFVVDRLGVPQEWVHAAVAMRAMHQHRYDEALPALEGCKQWALLHAVFMQQ